ncbi:MAG: protein kinase [bacterium]
MREASDAPELQKLDDKYVVLGELRGSDNARSYLGKRRDDDRAVMITVVRAANGGENNALSHFASDAQMLARISHPRVPQVVEGRWLGKNAYAVISERVPGTSLSEILSTGARLPNPHIATVLQDVDSVLEWARNQGVVHRGVTPDSLLFEQGTDRTIVMLALTPIALRGVPDAADDARTIGALAWAMLTGSAFEDEPSADALASARPDLAERVVRETVAMLRLKSGARPPDLQAFIAVIATGDELRRAEVEIVRLRTNLTEERRAERERIADERIAERQKFEYEQRVVEERATATERRLSAEREEFERRVAHEQSRMAAAERQLAAERLQFEEERLDLKERIAEVARLRAEVVEAKTDGNEPIVLGDPDMFGLETSDVPAGRIRWVTPLLVTGVLAAMIVIAATINRHGVSPSKTVSVGNGTVSETPSATPVAAINRASPGGFMEKPAASVTAERVISPIVRPNFTAARDSIALVALGDSIERQDSLAREDSPERRLRALERKRILQRARARDSIARLRPDTASR